MKNDDRTRYIVSKGLSLETIGLIVFIVFLILKLTGIWTSINWFWVFFPLWLPIAINVAVFLLVGLLIAFYFLITKKKK